ncbi:MAG: DUF2225 domain-containing protein [Spirochaetales bacterium]|nr:DUF2225 domain-containing protein [Spirochaetales bacterium]
MSPVKNQDNKKKKITFFSNKTINCPVCGKDFYREDLLTGGGRLIAGELSDELRRIYEPSVNYGEIYPLIYSITVCPECYYAAFPEDFSKIEGKVTHKLEELTQTRKKSIEYIFPSLNYTEPRGLNEGAASYFFALACYDFFPKYYLPTFKRGICSLRAAWLFNDLHRKFPSDNYEYLSQLFYRKASFYYKLVLEKDQRGEEGLRPKTNYGPDTDKNYGYDGILYISGILEYRYGPKKDDEKRIKSLENVKRLFSKLFGIGKASKQKPSTILDKAKDLYYKIGQEIDSLKGEA